MLRPCPLTILTQAAIHNQSHTAYLTNDMPLVINSLGGDTHIRTYKCHGQYQFWKPGTCHLFWYQQQYNNTHDDKSPDSITIEVIN